MDYFDKLYTNVTRPEAVALLVGSAITAIFGNIWRRLQNRTVVLRFSAKHNSFARSSEDLFGGKLQILFRGKEMKGLYITDAAIHNDSNTDIENLTVTLEYRNDEQYHGGSGKISDSSKKFPFSNDYQEKVDRLLKVKTQEEAEKFPDYSYVMRTREFLIPVLNRGSRADFNLLTHSDKQPQLYVICHHKGVKIVEKNEEKTLGIFMMQSAIVGLFACVILLFFLLPLFSSVGWAMAIAFSLGKLSTGVGLGLVALFRFGRRFLV